jgi:aryl-alcohol dehydrogenase-like predicted oxidoreductase
VVITTKVGGRVGPQLHEAGLSRRHILASVDRSLKRLGTDWIDSYVVHRDDPYTPMEETLSALDDVVRAGKVRYLGFSNWSAWRVAAAMDMMKVNGLAPFTHGQMYYSLLGRDIENEFLPMARQYGLGLTVWSPLAGGFLTGKYRRDEAAEADSRYAAFDMMPLDRELGHDLLDRMKSIAEAHGASVPQVAIAWLLSRQAVTSVILGASKPAQLDDNLKSASIELTADQLSALDNATATPKPYPGWFVERYADRKMDKVMAR